jgi:hypothetical protein
MSQRRITTAMAIVTTTLMMGFFTNCSQGDHAANLSSNGKLTDEEFFDYKYASKPEFYGDLNLLKPADQVSNLAQFKVIGTVAYIANANVAIAYTVKISAKDGSVLCPTQTGTIPAKTTYFEFDCVTVKQATTANIEFTVSTAGKSAVFRKTYYD